MVDIHKLIKEKQTAEYAGYFMQLQLLLASNNRVLKDEEYKTFFESLTKPLKEKDGANNKGKLDRGAMEVLRFMTNRGANFQGRR